MTPIKLATCIFLAVFISTNATVKSKLSEAFNQQWVSYQLAIYLPEFKKQTTESQIPKEAAAKLPSFKLVDALAKELDSPQILIELLNDVQTAYKPPSLQMIEYFGRGLSKAQALDIQEIEHAIVLTVAYPNKDHWHDLDKVQRFTYELAKEMNGFVWDEETREIFTVDGYKQRRFFESKQSIPSMKQHTVIHAYSNGEGVRAITLGMAKFGLPDIVVNDFSWSSNSQVGNLITAISQALAEGRRPNESDEFFLDLTQIKLPGYQAELKDMVLENAKLKGSFPLVPAKPDEGDPDNYLIEPQFTQDNVVSKQQAQETFLKELFGWKDEITYIKHNEEILAASAQAKKRLPELQKKFKAGYEPGAYLLLKAPFATEENGREWMWVEVTQWDSSDIKGILNNEPFHIPSLNAGATVWIKQDEVFDYIYYDADGNSEGNETGKLIQRFKEK